MKKILGIVVLGLLLSGNAYAGEMKEMPEGITVNSLIKDGWKLHSTNGVGFSGADGYGQTGVFYNLIKGREIVTCGASGGKVVCYKP